VRRCALPSANTYYNEDGIRDQHVASLARTGRTLQGRANVVTSHQFRWARASRAVPGTFATSSEAQRGLRPETVSASPRRTRRTQAGHPSFSMNHGASPGAT